MTTPYLKAPVGWSESLARSKAQIAGSESVPLLPVLDRIRASAERLEADSDGSTDDARQSARR